MDMKFECVNISSKDPKGLAEFYRKIGAPVYVQNENYDGWNLGNESEAFVCVWDENAWGKASTGPVTIAFKVKSVHKTYEELKEKSMAPQPPKTAVWGGQELTLEDPDGNRVLILDE